MPVRFKFTKFSNYQPDHLLEHVVAEVPARMTAELVGINYQTNIHLLQRLRTIIAQLIE